jgi:hypothetical protein
MLHLHYTYATEFFISGVTNVYEILIRLELESKIIQLVK